jgi:hypothetical protein
MTTRQPRYTKEDHARRGNEIYEHVVRSQIDEIAQSGKIVAIDIETKDFALGDDVLTASQRLLDHHPDAQTWFVRVGHAAVHRFGLHSLGST